MRRATCLEPAFVRAARHSQALVERPTGRSSTEACPHTATAHQGRDADPEVSDGGWPAQVASGAEHLVTPPEHEASGSCEPQRDIERRATHASILPPFHTSTGVARRDVASPTPPAGARL
jgi:hypothetical protein